MATTICLEECSSAKRPKCDYEPPSLPRSPSVEKDPRSEIDDYAYDPSDEHSEDENGMHEITEKEFEEYSKQVMESDGFDVKRFPRTFSCSMIQPMPLTPVNCAELKNYSELALNMYNEKEKTKLQFHKIVKANSSGIDYYITFDVKDHADGGSIKTYQAQVYSLLTTEVEFCRPEPAAK